MTAYVVSGIGMGAQFMPLTDDQRQMLEPRHGHICTSQLAQHPRMRPELRAAVVYALAEAGDTNLRSALDAQWSRRKDLQPEALAMTGLAMLQVQRRACSRDRQPARIRSRASGRSGFVEGLLCPAARCRLRQ